MKILITNDDGIDADGIQVLNEVAAEFGETMVVAPKHHQSGCSHQMTFEGHLEAEQRADNRWWVDGFPADCVRVGISTLLPDVDLVLSGINHGSNLGLDNFLSGTVAAAREATFFGLPAIAFSQYHRGIDQAVWDAAKVMTRRVIKQAIDGDRLVPGSYWNVNFPIVGDRSPDAIDVCEAPLDLCPLPNTYQRTESGFEYTGDYHARLKFDGTDVSKCHSGLISMSLIQVGSPKMVEMRKQARSSAG